MTRLDILTLSSVDKPNTHIIEQNTTKTTNGLLKTSGEIWSKSTKQMLKCDKAHKDLIGYNRPHLLSTGYMYVVTRVFHL